MSVNQLSFMKTKESKSNKKHVAIVTLTITSTSKKELNKTIDKLHALAAGKAVILTSE